jgi:general secretion pathway protein G
MQINSLKKVAGFFEPETINDIKRLSFPQAKRVGNPSSTERFRIPKHRAQASRNDKQNGFTLIEVLVVVFILGILAALVAPKMLGRTDDAKIAETKLQMKNLETALKLYKLDNGLYPTTDQGLAALIAKPESEPIPKKYNDDGYLEKDKIPKDAWGNPFIYISPGAHGDFDIISYGSDGKPGGEGKDSDIKSWEIE